MRKFLAACLLSLFVALPTSALDAWDAVVTKTRNAVVFIESDSGSCTGFVINQKEKFVMTAAHCRAKDDNDFWVDRVRGDIVSLDTKKDLMLVRVKELDPSHSELALAKTNPLIRQSVMSVGFGHGLERPFFKTAHVSDTAVMIPEDGIGGPFIGVYTAYTPGQSGGPVVDVNGNVVSIVQRHDNGSLGFGVGAEIIRERMGRFFPPEMNK